MRCRARPGTIACRTGRTVSACWRNIAIAIQAARAEHPAARFAVVDWDVHHGNGTGRSS